MQSRRPRRSRGATTANGAQSDEFRGPGGSYRRGDPQGGLRVRKVTYSMGMSADGFIVGPDGEIAGTAPDEEMWQFVMDEIRAVDVHLMGRRLYETMLYWERPPDDA